MARQTQESSSEEMTFFEHLDALRPHLVRGAVVLAVIMTLAFLGKELIIDKVLMGPQSPDFPTNRFFCHLGQLLGVDELCINRITLHIINTSLAGQFNLHIAVAFWAALVLTIPYLLSELWRFIKPALTLRERRASNKMVLYASGCFGCGLLFGYFLITPLAVDFLGGYTASEMITNMIDVRSYFSTVMTTSLACGLVFLLPLLVWFLARMGILSAAFMRRYRRHAIIVLAVVADVITPPDVFSMMLVMVPLYALYEGSIAIAVRVERKVPPGTR